MCEVCHLIEDGVDDGSLSPGMYVCWDCKDYFLLTYAPQAQFFLSEPEEAANS